MKAFCARNVARFSASADKTLTLAAVAVLAASLASRAAAANCASLVGKTFGDASVISAADIAPPFSVAGKDPPDPVSVKAPFCRVQGTIKPTADSDIGFEVWLPPQASWNGKVQGIGNGGFAGSLLFGPMAGGLEAGYAVSGTDTGHSGGPLESSWASGRAERIVDFGWRAIHLTAQTSKAIVAAYYGKPPAFAYFAGCGEGGRQALMEAQRFPMDYDGIVAGAPTNDWTKLMVNAVWVARGPGSAAELDSARQAAHRHESRDRGLRRRERLRRGSERLLLQLYDAHLQTRAIGKLPRRPGGDSPAEDLRRRPRCERKTDFSRFSPWRGRGPVRLAALDHG